MSQTRFLAWTCEESCLIYAGNSFLNFFSQPSTIIMISTVIQHMIRHTYVQDSLPYNQPLFVCMSLVKCKYAEGFSRLYLIAVSVILLVWYALMSVKVQFKKQKQTTTKMVESWPCWHSYHARQSCALRHRHRLPNNKMAIRLFV